MTIRPRSLSHENLIIPTPLLEEKNFLSQEALNDYQHSLGLSSDLSLKKIKSLSQEVFQHPEIFTPKNNPLELETLRNRDYALMNDPFVLVTKIRHITTERWLLAIESEPNNGILVFNYAKMHSLLKGDLFAQNIDPAEIVRNLHLSDPSYAYLLMSQDELYTQAQQLDFQGHCIYKSLVKAYTPLDYTTLEGFRASSGYEGTFSITAIMKSYLKLIELDPYDDTHYALLGKAMRYYSILSENLDQDEEPILLPLGMQTEEELYLKALEINPLNDEAYVGLGLLAACDSDHPSKLTHLKLCNSQDYVLHPHINRPTRNRADQNSLKGIDFYLKALQLNPYNFEAALLLSETVEAIRSLDGHLLDIFSVMETAMQKAPCYLATIPHWRKFINLKYPHGKDICSNLVKTFIHSPLERHIKRNALQALIQAVDPFQSYLDDDKHIDFLAFLSLTHLVDRELDRHWIEYTFKEIEQDDPVFAYLTSLLTRLLQSHFPYDEQMLKKMITPLRKILKSSNFPNFIAYYHLATLICPHETVDIQGDLFSQQQLYLKAAEKTYHFSYPANGLKYLCDLATNILTSYAVTLEDNETYSQEDHAIYNVASFSESDPLTQKNLFLKAFTIDPHSAWPYFYLGKIFTKPVEIQGKRFDSAQNLFLEALRLDLSHAQAYYHLGKTLHDQESITLSNGLTLSHKQLYQRAVQLGIQEPQAYLNTAQILKEKEGVMSLDQRTCFLAIDLLFRAFTLSHYSPYYLHQIALHFKKKKPENTVTF
ncbi:MAG: hypothetical protein QRY72_00225 [Candidatus Rhabdochlamydia sp.]